jgi:hypothetical protein
MWLCGKFLHVHTRCFAAAQGGSWLRRTLTHHPSAGLRWESFGFYGEPIEKTAVMAFGVPGENFGFHMATPFYCID